MTCKLFVFLLGGQASRREITEGVSTSFFKRFSTKKKSDEKERRGEKKQSKRKNSSDDKRSRRPKYKRGNEQDDNKRGTETYTKPSHKESPSGHNNQGYSKDSGRRTIFDDDEISL